MKLSKLWLPPGKQCLLGVLFQRLFQSTVRTDTDLLLAALVSIENIGKKEGSHTSFKIELL